MNQLFNCKNIRWNGTEYEELPEQIENGDIDYNDDNEEQEEY